MAGKRLQLLREVAPTIARIAALSDTSYPDTDLRETEAAARALGVRLHVWKVRSGGELDRAFPAIARARAVGIIILPGATLFAYRAHIAQLAVKHRLPTSAWTRDLAEAGSPMSYGANQHDVARRAAYFVDKILKGAKPADLPIEQPSKFESIISLKTAKALGLTIPPSVLGRADEVIQ
jgi:putative ABC transport system substrate-binding protein